MYATGNRTNHTYTYVAMVIDGTPYTLNTTYSGSYLNWGNTIGVEIQLDGNSSGTAIHEWVDQWTLTVW